MIGIPSAAKDGDSDTDSEITDKPEDDKSESPVVNLSTYA